MNRHSRIIVVLLLLILSALCAAIILFRMDIGKNTDNSGNNLSVSVSSEDSSTVIVYKDSNGLYGLKDRSDNIILEPEWSELTSIGNSGFRAKLNTRTGTLYGVIDRKGDIAVPFVYDDITHISDYLYSARLRDSGQYHFYGNDLSLVTEGAADKFFLEGTSLIINQGQDTFTYKQGDKLSLVRAEIPRFKRPVILNIMVENPKALSIMDCIQWSNFGDDTIAFLDAIRRNNSDLLYDASEINAFSDVSNEIKELTSWKGKLSENTFVYTADYGEEISIFLETELLFKQESENKNETELNIPLKLEYRKSESTGEWLIYKANVNYN